MYNNKITGDFAYLRWSRTPYRTIAALTRHGWHGFNWFDRFRHYSLSDVMWPITYGLPTSVALVMSGGRPAIPPLQLRTSESDGQIRTRFDGKLFER